MMRKVLKKMCSLAATQSSGRFGRGLVSKFQRFSDFANSSRVREVTSFTKSCVGAAEYALFSEPSAIKIVNSALTILEACLRFTAIDPDHFFSDGWRQPFSPEFNHVIVAALADAQQRSLTTTQLGTKITIATIDGCDVAWITPESMSTRRISVEQVHVRSDQIAAARAAISRALWRRYHDSSIVLKRVTVKDIHGTSTMNTFVEDHDEPPLRSNRAEKLAEYLGRAIAGGVTRSVLLWGNPGTGKSCLARAVIDVLGLRCMRFRVEDLGRLSNSTVAEAIELFAPGAVIIDDLDRLNGRYEHLFEMLAFLKRRVKLVFGTINDRKKLPAPLRRPGRFDERREIQVIDHDVVRAMLGPQFQDDFELVKDWPIVYVEEYVTRRRFEAPEELAETVRELRECMLELEISNNGRNVADDNHDDDEEYEHDDDDAEELQVDQSDDLDEATEFTITIPTDQTVCHV